MAPTANWIKETRRYDAALATMAKVTLTDPSARTLYLTTGNAIRTPDNVIWEGAVKDFEAIRAPGGFLDTGPNLCSTGFSLILRATLGFQTTSTVVPVKNVSDLFAEFRWIGATVEIFIWPLRATVIGDLQQVFKGVVQNFRIGLDTVDVRCLQNSDWTRIVSPEYIRRSKYPRAPERNLGLALPIVYGEIKNPPIRTPWRFKAGYSLSGYSSPVHHLEHIAQARIALPVLQVDSGRGGGATKSKYLATSHAVKQHNDLNEAATYFIKLNDVLHPLEIDFPVNDANGAGFELPDDFDKCSYGIIPSEPRDTAAYSNPGDDGELAIDGSEATFARLTYQPSPLIDKRRIQWLLPAISPPGEALFSDVYIRLLYKSTATLTSFYVGMYNIAAGGTIVDEKSLGGNTTPRPASIQISHSGTWGNGFWPSSPWLWSDCIIAVGWTGVPSLPAAREDVWVYAIGLEIRLRPGAQSVAVSTKRPTQHGRVSRSGGPRRFERGEPTPMAPLAIQPPDSAIVGTSLLGTLQGMADDGSGTYTGTASALIELAPDIAHHLLRTYGGQAASRIQTAASTFGSFVDARLVLLRYGVNDSEHTLKFATVIDKISDLGEVLSDLAQSSLSQYYLDRFTDKIHFVPWVPGSIATQAGATYGRKVHRDDIIEFEAELIPSSRLVAGIRIPYGWDADSQSYRMVTHCSRGASQSGHDYYNIRDQYLTVVNDESDRLDFSVAGAAAVIADVAASAYSTVHAACKALDAAMESASVGNDFMVATPLTIEAGYNDKIDFNDGVNRVGTIAPGTYSNFILLVTAVSTAMNAVSSSWTASYSPTTQKVTIDRTSGTKTLLLSSGANKATTIYTQLGYSSEQGDITAGVAGKYEVAEDRVVIECLTGTLDLLLASGTYGSQAAAPKSIAEVMGYDGAYDRDAQGARRWWIGESPKGIREQTLTTATDKYGQRRELVIEGKAIYKTETAWEIRNRLIQWAAEPRVVVRFSTTRMADLMRGQLIEFGDLDQYELSYPKPGSDLQWAGKRFRVMQVEQGLGPDFSQQIEAIEND